jgi:hypothetical protein
LNVREHVDADIAAMKQRRRSADLTIFAHVHMATMTFLAEQHAAFVQSDEYIRAVQGIQCTNGGGVTTQHYGKPARLYISIDV